jgi:heme-degrading monooxygenase HmoA
MIARMWRGWTRPEDANDYAEGLRERIRGQVSMPGKIGSVLLSQRKGERCEFVTISFWESLDAIRVLASEQLEQAVFFPLDDQYLVDRETTVTHFDVVGSEGVGLPARGPASCGAERSRATPKRSVKSHAA